jgi:hypothetical protein
MEEFRVDHEFDIHAYPKVDTIRIEYPATTYRVNLRPTYECYIQQDEIVAKGEDVTVEFEMYDHDRQITYPSIHVKLYVKREQRHVFTDKIILPEIGDDGKYRFSLNTVRDLPLGHKVFRLEFCDYRAVLRSRALLLK